MRIAFLLLVCLFFASAAQAQIDVPIAYLEQQVEQPPTLSNLDPRPENLGLSGAELGLADNATTGGFLGHNYSLSVHRVPPDGDFLTTAREVLNATKLLVVQAPPSELLALADIPEAQGALIFNASAEDNDLRSADCRANVLHSMTSYAMRGDALAQLMSKKGWRDLALIVGTHTPDLAFAEALRASATKFGLTIVGEETWAFDADIRRNASQEIPVFTQSLAPHDVLLLSDEVHDFGRYVLYNTWEPRLIAGSEGVVPVAWSSVVEQWGAAQLQNRFTEMSGRKMRSLDYAAWAAVRSIGEAVTRTSQADAGALRSYILSDKFELAGFKGRPMNYRGWNGQLRQPVPLVHPRALVALAPLEGFLHEHTELDTLGLDASESACQAFEE